MEGFGEGPAGGMERHAFNQYFLEFAHDYKAALVQQERLWLDDGILVIKHHGTGIPACPKLSGFRHCGRNRPKNGYREGDHVRRIYLLPAFSGQVESLNRHPRLAQIRGRPGYAQWLEITFIRRNKQYTHNLSPICLTGIFCSKFKTTMARHWNIG